MAKEFPRWWNKNIGKGRLMAGRRKRPEIADDSAGEAKEEAAKKAEITEGRKVTQTLVIQVLEPTPGRIQFAVMYRPEIDQAPEKRTPKQTEFLENMKSQYDQALRVWTEVFPIDTRNAPTKAAAEKWLNGLPGDTVTAMRRYRKTAQFVLVPDLPVQGLLKAIDGRKLIPRQAESEIWWRKGWEGVKAPKWKFAITDGRPDVPFDPNAHYTYSNRPGDKAVRTAEEEVAEYRRRFEIRHLGIMPQYGYLPAVAAKLAHGQILDKLSYTTFERPEGADYLPDGYWDEHCIGLGKRNPNVATEDVRCRWWIEGEAA